MPIGTSDKGAHALSLDAKLLNILACPQDHGPLMYVPDELLYNPRMRVAYPIDHGLPVLLISESRAVDDDEHNRIVKVAGTTGAPRVDVETNSTAPTTFP